jgi:flagellar biosynthesis GTPase FlhF
MPVRTPTIANLFDKLPQLPAPDFAASTKAALEQVAKVDAANLAKFPHLQARKLEEEWQELDRYFATGASVQRARDTAADAVSEVNSRIGQLEFRLKAMQQALAEPGLLSHERSFVEKAIQRYSEDVLPQAKREREVIIRRNGSNIKRAEEMEPLRKRWQELSAERELPQAAREIAREALRYSDQSY